MPLYRSRRDRGIYHADRHGIVGNGTDVTSRIQDLLDIVADNGGGRIILPQGITRADSAALQLSGSGGIVIQGAGIGESNANQGTTLRLNQQTSGSKFIIGEDGAALRSVMFTDMRIVGSGVTNGQGYLFQSNSVRNLYFRNLHVGSALGFLQSGAEDNLTNMVFIHNVEAGLLEPTAVTLGSAPFATTDASADVVVTDVGHDFTTGEVVSFDGAAAVAGITIDGAYDVTVLTEDTYQITHSATANATTTGGGSAVARTHVYHGIDGVNCGNLVISDSHIEGPPVADMVPGSCVIRIGPDAFSRPDGVNIGNCGFGLFDRGLEIKHGAANIYCASTFFDRCGTYGLNFQPNDDLLNVIYDGCHIAGARNGSGDFLGLRGVNVERVGSGSAYEMSFTDCHILHFLQEGLYFGGPGTNLVVADNRIWDVACGTANTYDAIVVDDTWDQYNVSDNNIALVDESNAPRYGINLLSTGVKRNVTNNVIGFTPGTGYVNNPNRGSAQTSRVCGNTGQVFEGTTNTYQVWCELNAAANLTNAEMEFNVGGVGSVSRLRAPARGRIVHFWAKCITAISAGTAICRPAINGSVAAAALSALQSGTLEVSTTHLDGYEFAAGDDLGFFITTDASWSPTTAEVYAGMTVVYD